MSLFSLSNELLIYISQFLDYADDFSAFSRTCLRLYSLVNPLLFLHYAIQNQCDALIYAMDNGDYVLMERLIQAGVNLFTYEEMTHHALLPTAARNGHLGMVQVLLDLTHEDIHYEAVNDDVPLVGALLYGHLDTARFLVSQGALPDFKSSMDQDRTALSFIAEQGPLASVKFLLEEATSDIETQDSKGFTPLLYAASHGSLETVKCLIKAGADPMGRDNQGRSIIFHAAHHGHTDVSLFLLDIDCSNDLLNDLDAMSLAHIASEGRGQSANMLLERMDVNAIIASAADQNMLVPLFFSCAACGLDLFIQHFLEKGCDPLAKILLEKEQIIFDETVFHKYDNALKQAASNGHISTVQLLLDSINAENPSKLGQSIIDIIPIAAENNAVQLLQDILDTRNIHQLDPDILDNCLDLTAPYEETTQLLLNYGANPAQDGYGGFYFLQQVVKQGSASCVKMLPKATGLNPLQPFPFELNDHYFTSLLETATAYRDLEMVKQLLEASNVDFNPANEECQLALSSALNWQRLDIHIQKSVEIIKYFLDHGFDVNCKAERGCEEAPLLIKPASMPGDSAMILNLLLSYGASVHMAGDFQRAALWQAAQYGRHARIAALLDHGADPLQQDSEGQTPLDASMSDYKGASLKIILKAIEDKRIQVDLTGLIEKAKEAFYDENEENRLLKYLKQHQCRVMYPCA